MSVHVMQRTPAGGGEVEERVRRERYSASVDFIIDYIQ